MFRNLIWDFDGTLFDTYTAQTNLLSKIMDADYGLIVPPGEIRKLTSQSLGFAVNELARMADASTDILGSKFSEEYSKLSLSEEQPFPYAAEICRKIAAGEGCNMINTHRGRLRMLLLLKEYGMDMLFKHTVAAEDNLKRKPDPESFVRLIELSGVKREETLAVGDRPIDIYGAADAGLPTFFFNSNNIDSSKIKSDYASNSLKTILEFI